MVLSAFMTIAAPATLNTRQHMGPSNSSVDRTGYTRRKRDKWAQEDIEVIPEDWRPAEDETLDLILRKKVFLLQSRRGYRANTDSHVLSYFASRRREASIEEYGDNVPLEHRAIDLGAGNGLVSILYGVYNKSSQIELVELQESLAWRAQRNLGLNNLLGRSHVTVQDLATGLPSNFKGQFDVVLCNPPFYRDPNSRSPPTVEEKLLAHFESSADMGMFARSAAEALSTASDLSAAYFIYDSRHSARVLGAIQSADLVVSATRLVHHRPDQKAIRILIEAKLPHKCRMKDVELPPLVLHPEGTSETEHGDDMEKFFEVLPIPQYRIGKLRDLT